ncbi:MAG TPA: hypothetical protein VKD21_09775 [Acidimicrobiales bacterium]|nr:hypothetical protein [Acidimicrobiales bacterium]
MKGDPDLRARLERLASNAGDPPERGLDRVAARRHRRLRRRRGAVVTAAALAVLLGAVLLVTDGGPDDNQVAVSPAGRPSGTAAQLPDVVDFHCRSDGPAIPVASVRPQSDGMHIRVFNELSTSTEVRVVKEDEWTGRRTFSPGMWSMRQPVPPGTLRIGCEIAGRERSLTVELVDVHGYYQEPGLECPSDDTEAEVTDLGRAEPGPSMSATTYSVLQGRGLRVEELRVGPPRGYPRQLLGDPTDDPKVQVNRRGDTVAFVHLQQTDDRPDAPWSARAIEGCQSFLTAAPTTDTTVAA